MPNPTAALLVIGDEILSGRTRDVNTHHLAGALTEHGVDLREARVVPDETAAIVEAVNALRARYSYVFTSGGIGPTHDDITADAVAAAFGVSIDVRADARAVLERYYAENDIELNEARLRMARVPDGASLIGNPVSAAPGFRLENVFVMAGVPKIFAAMLDGVLPSLTAGRPMLSATVRADRPEGEVASPLAEVAARFPDVSIGSYPHAASGRLGTNIVLRCPDAARLEAARAAVEALLA
ncbi:MAG: competence/damage-inducible protein A [Paracoccaceae bacterium]